MSLMRVTLVTLLLVVAPEAVAQREVHAPLVLTIPWSARSLGMGGATAGSRDVDAAAVNPALLGAAAGFGAAAGRLDAGATTGAAGMQSVIGPFSWGLAAAHLAYRPDITAVTPSTDVLETRGSGQGASVATSVGLAATFKGFRLGAAVNVFEERINLDRAAGSSLTLGVARDALFGRIAFGAALQHLGPDLRFSGGDYSLPTRLAVGFSGAGLPLGAWWDLSAIGGVAVRRDGELSGSLGAELAWVPIEGISVAFRGGVRRAELAELGALTGGLGASFDRVAIDLAWEQMRDGGAYRVGFRVR